MQYLKYCKNPDCNKMFMAKVNQTQRCTDCAKAHRTALQAVWREEHRDNIKEYNNIWTAAQCHAKAKMKVIRRERLKRISEIESLRSVNDLVLNKYIDISSKYTYDELKAGVTEMMEKLKSITKHGID